MRNQNKTGHIHTLSIQLFMYIFLVSKLSPASEASMEVANLTERKNLHTPIYGVKEFVCKNQLKKSWQVWLHFCKPVFVSKTANLWLNWLFWQKIITLTSPILRGVWNLPHKFHLYLVHINQNNFNFCL